MPEVLARDIIMFRKAYDRELKVEGTENEGMKDQIIRLETILFDMGILPANKTKFGIIFSKKEYPIHVVVKHHTLIFQ